MSAADTWCKDQNWHCNRLDADYQEPGALLEALIEQHRDRYARAKTYTELCDTSKDYKRMREEWAQASEDAWMVNLHRVLPRLVDES